MNFFDKLQASTEDQRRDLFSLPLITRTMQGDVDLPTYVAFLYQAYHHVRHTASLMMAAGARIPPDREWLRVALARYIEEEIGHDAWILDDIAVCGYDKEAVRRSRPNLATELMVAYGYDTIHRVSPLGIFGMVYVLEGTSAAIATTVAAAVKKALNLPDQALSYLYSHGSLDQEHIRYFESLMNRIDDVSEQALIIHCTRVFYRLYGDVLRSVSRAVPAHQPAHQAGSRTEGKSHAA